MTLVFDLLEPKEIECKATLVENNKLEIALHLKAATCTKRLDKAVGPMGWEKEYTNGNKNCIVRIWDESKQRMISKEDCGGSLTEVDGLKGQASNGFKRACMLGWGLGIELYTQPRIRLARTESNTVYDEKKGMIVSESYSVKEIEYNEDKEITRVVIVDSMNRVVYDGPNENGESDVVSVEEDDDIVIIPENADMENDEYQEESDDLENTTATKNDDTAEDVSESESVVEEKEPVVFSVPEESDIVEDLPDNTDGFEEGLETQEAPFGSFDYKKELEKEIKRTHTKREDVLNVLGIKSFDEVKLVDEALLDETLKKLQARATYPKRK